MSPCTSGEFLSHLARPKMCKCCSPKVALVIRVLYASMGIVIGLVICAVFNVAFENKSVWLGGLGVINEPVVMIL